MRPPSPLPPPAFTKLLAAEVENRPFGVVGARTVAQDPTPLFTPLPPVTFPAPDWELEKRERDAADRAANRPPFAVVDEEEPARRPPPQRAPAEAA